MKISKTVCDPNLIVFIQMVIDLAKQGWELDEQNPPMLLGFCYECQMLRDEDIEDPPAKLTRAEIAAKARAALAEKRAAEKAAEVSEKDTQTSDKADDDKQRSEAETEGA